MIEREYKKEDIENIKLNDMFNDLVLNNENYAELLVGSINSARCFTLEEKGEVIFIWGFTEYAKGHYNIFLIPSVYFRKYMLSICRFCKNKFKYYLDLEETKRIGTMSIDCDILNRWHKFLGFIQEGTLKRFIYGKDYIMWRMLNGN